MYLADYHVHSTCSPDGHQTMAQAAEAAVRQGLNELCITDHVDTLYWDDFRPRWDFDWDEPGASSGRPRPCGGTDHPAAGGGVGRRSVRL